MASPAPADRFLFYAFLGLLLWMPLPFGSNVTWASSLMEAWIFLIAGLWLVQYYRGKVSLNQPFVRAWPVTACLVAVPTAGNFGRDEDEDKGDKGPLRRQGQRSRW